MSPALLDSSTPFTPEMEAVMRRRAERSSLYFDTSCSESESNTSPSSPASSSPGSRSPGSCSPMFDSESELSNDSAPAIRAIIRQTPPHIRTFFASVPSATYMNEPHMNESHMNESHMNESSELRNLATPSPTELDVPDGPDADINSLSTYEEAMYTYPSPP